jgi:hypothetical protein
MPATFNPSGVATVLPRCSVGCHPRLFTLNPSGIPARDLEQTIAGFSLSFWERVEVRVRLLPNVA